MQEEIAESFKAFHQAELAMKEHYEQCLMLENTVERLRSDMRSIKEWGKSS